MNTMEVLTRIKASGLTLRPSGARLVVAGNQPLTEQQRQFIRQHKASILKALAATPSQPTATAGARPVAPKLAVTEPLPNWTDPPEPGSTQPFNQQALDAIKAGAGCWVWSGTLEEWIFVVRDEDRKAKATSRGIDPGCIWTLAEITGVAGMPPEVLRDVAAIKRRFAGTVQPGEVPARWREIINPLDPAVTEEALP